MKIDMNNLQATEIQPVITICEAANLYRIGQKKLRAMIKAMPHADWVWNNGRYNYIRRREFEQYLAKHHSASEII